MNLSQIADAKLVASEVITTSMSGHRPLLAAWQKAIDLVWDSHYPASILAEFGGNAVALFTVSTETYTYLESMEPGCCADRICKVRPCTPHADGTVTLN